MQWIVLVAVLGALLTLDLWLARRDTGAMRPRTAGLQSAGWLLVATAFGGVVALARGGEDAGAYLAGFLVEKSLSLDNVFVFLLIMTSFGVAAADRHRLLTIGIAGALVMRAAFIVAGAAALHAAGWLSFVFAAVLVWTGWRMLRHRHDSDGEAAFVEKLRRRLPGGTTAAALGALVIADAVFAVDSVPSILAITDDTYVVFAANAFALLGLAPLFFLVADLVERLRHLKTALAVLLMIIAGKLAAGEIWGHVPTGLSLGVVALVLGTGVVTSLWADRADARAASDDLARTM